LVLPSWKVLHRVSEITWEGEDGEMIEGEGITVCGKSGFLRMPGIFSRMGLERCKRCCQIMKIPNGKGAPFNAKDLDETQRNA
jgi:hypothetical protein